MTIEAEINRELSSVRDSGTNKSIIELGWLELVKVAPPRIVVRLTLPGFAQSQRERFAKEIKDCVSDLPNIEDVQIELADYISDEKPIGQAGHGEMAPLQPIKGVKNVIAVSSGKGGVGKSTIAVNLACALARQNFKVGLLDADIYGPNIPTMLGVGNISPEVEGSGNNQQILPINNHGIDMVSMGSLINDDQPVIWRGPMLNGIIRQFLYQAKWGDKDFLIVDLPPGTGDAQLSLAQAVPMKGVLIVTTPQKVSLQDARRGLMMFKQMNIRILGIVENMSFFIPPDMPDRSYEIFGKGGGEKLAQEHNVPLLVKIPLEIPVSEFSTQGIPIVARDKECQSSINFLNLANKVKALVEGEM